MKTDQKDSPAEQSVYSLALTYMGDDLSKFAKALLLAKIHKDAGSQAVSPKDIRKVLGLDESQSEES